MIIRLYLSHVVSGALLIAIFLFSASGPASAQPRMKIIGGDTLDWGRVAPDMLQRDVRIVNIGSDTLHITLEPSCGCTVAPLDKSALGAGDTATAKVSIDMTNRSGDQLKHVKVLSNDPERKSLALVLKAHILRDLTVEPSAFRMKTGAKVNEEYDVSVQLENTSERPLRIIPPEPVSNDSITIRFDPAEPLQLLPGETLSLTAYVTPHKEGIITSSVMLRTSGPYTGKRQLLLICSVPMIREGEG